VDSDVLGGVEIGGTKVVCAIGSGPDALLAETTIPTTTPEETLARVVAFLRAQPVAPLRIGVASFGPLDVDVRSATYGRILATPKPGWRDVDLRRELSATLRVPVVVDTDVNGAALAEATWGAAGGLATFCYITVGTGIGMGGMANGALLHGRGHPEFGHLRLPHDRAADPFAGVCPFHGDCLEGLTSGPAIAARWGAPGEALPDDHPAWALEARYLADALLALLYALAPQRVLVGGGVAQQPALLPLVRRFVRERNGGYLASLDDAGALDGLIVAPALGRRAGVLGALALAAATDSAG
jgi:fructokinase